MVAVALTLIAVALGLGAYSSLMFTWQWLVGPPNQLIASFLCIAVTSAAIGLVALVSRRTGSSSFQFGAPWVGLLVAAVFATYWMTQLTQKFPYGYADAWAIWNGHARFLYRDGGAGWLRLFDSERAWFHPDYPYLLPGLISAIWTILGGERAAVPPALACGFVLLSIGIMSTSVSALSKDQRGAYAGLILTATPSFLLLPAAQYADLPLGLYMLTTVVLLAFADAWTQVRMTLLASAGLAAGMAAWTKNEGLLFVVVVMLVQLARVARQPPAVAGRELGAFIVGLTPMLTLLVAFKLTLSPPSDIVNGSSLQRTFVAARWTQVSSTFLLYARSFGDAWFRYTHPSLLLAAYTALFMRAVPRRQPLMLLAAPVLMLTGYFIVYLVTPFDLTWHLATSLDRLYLQIWPMTVFVVAVLPTLCGAVERSEHTVTTAVNPPRHQPKPIG